MEQKSDTKTEMTNPPSNSTNMTQSPKQDQEKKPVQPKAKTVKLRAIMTFPYNGKTYVKGDVLENVPMEDAKLLTKKRSRGYFAFAGERGGDDSQARHGHNKCIVWREEVKEELE